MKRATPERRAPLPSRFAGFTLVELMIVLAIVAILVSLLMPAFRSARAQAHLVTCQSNLRTIGVAAMAYAADHNRRYPHRELLGGVNYRMAPGRKSVGDNAAPPERFGLAAVLHGIRADAPLGTGLPPHKYLPGDSKVWVCPAQPSWMTDDNANTYAFSIAPILIRPGLGGGKTSGVYVWDNYMYLAPPSGSFQGSMKGYTIDVPARIYPHQKLGEVKGANGSVKRRGAVSELHLDGRVDLRIID